MNRRIANTAFWLTFLVTGAWFAPGTNPTPERLHSHFFIYYSPAISLFFAYAIGFWAAWRVFEDYPRGSAMRLAWTLIAASCGAAAIRYGYEAVVTWTGGVFIESNPLLSLRQIPNVAHSILLLLGLIAMWRSYSTLRIGVRLRWPDALTVVTILVILRGTLANHRLMPDAGAAHPLFRALQIADAVPIVASAILGVILHRISLDVGRSEIAASLRYMVFFLISRPLLPSLRFLPWMTTHPERIYFLVGLGRAADWIFVLGVIYQWRAIQRTRALAGNYEKSTVPESSTP